jgi:bifunctional enzyme CysN/CysC
VKRGDSLRIAPSGKIARVARIVTADGDLDQAVADQSVTLTLTDEVDVARGDLLSPPDAAPSVSDQFEVTLVWMADQPMLPGRSYWLKLGSRTVSATVTELKYQVNVNTLEHTAAKTLELNGIAICNISVAHPVPFDSYTENHETGGFILIDRMNNTTVGAGMILFALRRSQNIHWQSVDIDRAARAASKHQKPAILWFTGLSGAGKSTIANLVEKRLHVAGKHTYMLDGDNVRHGLNRDLGFTDADRVENIRRVGEVSKLMVDAGLIVMVSFISPFRSERRMARELVDPGEFFEVYVDTPLALAEERDPKGLYKRARRGEIKNFTGIDSPYEPPDAPEITLDTAQLSAEEAAEAVIQKLIEFGIIAAA